ncbi:MAG: AMP-binding protein [Deltaproteobacteria bacterium]|nr:AMP-binding protein [Deltaproteobacteria bacterium]
MSTGRTFSTIRTLLNRNAMLYPDKIAMKEVEGDRTLTYQAMKDRANRVGNALYEIGARKGDRVAILSQNSLEYMESAINIPNAGLIFVVCNFRLAPPEIAAVLADAEPTILLVQQQFVEIVEKIIEFIPSIRHFIYFCIQAAQQDFLKGSCKPTRTFIMLAAYVLKTMI